MNETKLAELSLIDSLLSDEEQLVRSSVRRFLKENYAERVARYFEEERFPEDLIEPLLELGLLGASLTGYGRAGMSAVEYGLVLAETVGHHSPFTTAHSPTMRCPPLVGESTCRRRRR
jgi:alkylation response protein AidB-like acyl-CoA dehydrogenase